MGRHIFTPKETSFVKRHIAGRSCSEMANLLNLQHFGEPVTAEQIKGFKENHGIRSGTVSVFRPGHIPYNKGMKGYCVPGSEKGWFKKGHKLNVQADIGAERVTDGYVQVKVSNRKDKPWKRWKSKHQIIWEKAHGKVPRGHVVIFADGNNRNFNQENLLLVSRAELAVMNHFKLMSPIKNLTQAGQVVADIKMAVADRKRRVKQRTRQRKRRAAV